MSSPYSELGSFDDAFRTFEARAYGAIRSRLHDMAGKTVGLARANVLIGLAEDIGYNAMTLRELHQRAVTEIEQRITAHSALSPVHASLSTQAHGEASPIIVSQLWAMLKAFFYPIRAYQDGLYRLAVGAFDGPATKVGMTKAVRDNGEWTEGQVAKFLSQRIPEYAAWFRRIRGLRNLIKDGSSMSYQTHKWFIPPYTLTITCRVRDPFAGMNVEVGLQDAADALSMSAAVTAVILDALPHKTHLS